MPDLRPELMSNLASLGDRLLGQILDDIVAFAVACVGALAIYITTRSPVLSVAAAVLTAALYVLLSDGFENGQSYGKRIVKTAVVDADTGEPCGYGQSLIRNLLLSILGLIDCVFIFGRKRQRLGDMAANTVVVKRA